MLFVKPSRTCPGRPTGLCNVNFVGYSSLSSDSDTEKWQVLCFVPLSLLVHRFTHLLHLTLFSASFYPTGHLTVKVFGQSQGLGSAWTHVLPFGRPQFWTTELPLPLLSICRQKGSAPSLRRWLAAVQALHHSCGHFSLMPCSAMVSRAQQISCLADALSSLTWYDGGLHGHDDVAECPSGALFYYIK